MSAAEAAAGRSRGWRGPAALGILTLVSLVSLVFFYRYRTAAFPEHAVRFAVNRDQAAARSLVFLQDTLGQTMEGYTEVTTFQTDDLAKTYLEKHVGVSRTAEIAAETDLWHFHSRYFRPLLHEEYQVNIAPDGRIVGYRHLIDETQAGARLDRTQALARAEALRRTLVRAPGDWYLAQDASTEQSFRRDWHFEWFRRDFQPTPGSKGTSDEGWEQLSLDLQGNRLGGFQASFGVPESWTRQYARIRSANNLIAGLDGAFGFLPLVLVALAVTVRGFVRRSLRLRTPAWLALIGGLLTVGASLNALPLSLGSYSKDVSWLAFLVQLGAGALLTGVVQALAIFLFGSAGELLYRERFRQHLTLASCCSWRGVMSRPGARALAVGGLLTTVMAAYQIVYYIAGRSIGIWTPADLPYSNLYSTFAPWFYPLTTGYTAATFEEFAFRLFAIPLLLGLFVRLLRSVHLATVLAVVLSALIWALLHSTYPQDPFFARGLELTLVGCVFGWLLVRYGILASLAVHYCFDAFLSAAALDHIQTPQFRIAAYVLTAVPLLLAMAAAVRAHLRGGFVAEQPLLNAVGPTPAPAGGTSTAALPSAWRYQGLPRTRCLLAAVLGLAGLFGLLALQPPARHPFRLDRSQAGAEADAALARAGVNPAGYRRILTLESQTDPIATRYLRDHGGNAALQAVYGDFIPPFLWQARYVRPLQPDEYLVQLRPDGLPGGAPFAITFDLASDSPGARLSQPVALKRAEQALAAYPGWGGVTPVLIAATTTQVTGHTEHTFVFERPDVRYGGASLRANLQVIGDHISGYAPFVYVPSEARFQHNRMGAPQMIAGVLLVGLILAWFSLAVAAFFQLARAQLLPVRPALAAAGAFLALAVVDELNGLPVFFRGYATALPVPTFLASTVAGRAALELTGSIVAAGAFSLLVGLWRTQVVPTVLPTGNRRRWALDTALLSVAIPMLTLGVVPVLNAAVPPSPTALPNQAVASAPAGVETLVPALAVLTQARWVILVVLTALASYLVVRRAVRRRSLLLRLGAAVLLLLIALVARSAAEAGAIAAAGVLALLILVAVTRFFLRSNLMAYVTTGLSLALLAAAQSDLQAANRWLVGNGIAVLATLIGLAVLLILILAAGRAVPVPISEELPVMADTSEKPAQDVAFPEREADVSAPVPGSGST